MTLCLAIALTVGTIAAVAIYGLWRIALEDTDREETFRDHTDYDGDA